jgi:hypothetical protein
MRLALLTLLTMSTFAADPSVAVSRYLAHDTALSLDPSAELWARSTAIQAERGRHGEPEAQFRTEIRTCWSGRYLYILYTCPYQRLYLKPNPVTSAETNHLWDWDVAEVFIGADFQNIGHYTEYEVSPQGEWVDLDIDRHNPASPGLGWRSGFETRASIDREHKVWHGAMKIPFDKIGLAHPAAGQSLRINFYRIEGPPPDRTYIVWQPVNSDSFHEPKAFGTLRLEK